MGLFTRARVVTLLGFFAGNAGCSLVVPLSDYDQGAGSGSGGGARASSSASSGSASSGGGSASGGGTCAHDSTRPAISSLVDRFPAGPGVHWTAVGDCARVENGELVVEPEPRFEGDGKHFCWFETSETYRLTCDAFTVKVTEATASVLGAQTFIYVLAPAGELFLLKQGEHYVLLEEGGDPWPTTRGWDPDRDRWWRVREHDGVVSFETSPDGETWERIGDAPTPFSFDAIRVALGAGSENPWATPEPGRARFDCFNADAPCP